MPKYPKCPTWTLRIRRDGRERRSRNAASRSRPVGCGEESGSPGFAGTAAGAATLSNTAGGGTCGVGGALGPENKDRVCVAGLGGGPRTDTPGKRATKDTSVNMGSRPIADRRPAKTRVATSPWGHGRWRRGTSRTTIGSNALSNLGAGIGAPAFRSARDPGWAPRHPRRTNPMGLGSGRRRRVEERKTKSLTTRRKKGGRARRGP